MAQQGNGASEEATVDRSATDRSTSQSVGRFLGRVARKATRLPALPRRWVDPRPVGILLEELVELVTTRSDEGYRVLERDPQFWALVEGLHSKRPKIVRKAHFPTDQGEPVPSASDEDVGLVDAQLADPNGDASASPEDAAAPPEGAAASAEDASAPAEAAEPEPPAEQPAAQGSASDEEAAEGSSSAETDAATKEVDQ